MDTSLALGLDYGLRRIGVAVGSRATGAARALTTLPCEDGTPDWDRLAALLEEWRPDRLVVGLPLNLDGTESEMTARARRFARRLEGRFQLPVEMIDERLSSAEALATLKEDRRTGRRRRPVAREDVDREAAAVILQAWLDR